MNGGVKQADFLCEECLENCMTVKIQEIVRTVISNKLRIA